MASTKSHWYSSIVFEFLLFPEKEAKSVCSASQKAMGYPNLGEADPGGSGGLAPQKTPYDLQPVVIFFFFQKKKQKAFVLLRRRPWATQTSAKPTQGGLGG
jgi:hypothetical protein